MVGHHPQTRAHPQSGWLPAGGFRGGSRHQFYVLLLFLETRPELNVAQRRWPVILQWGGQKRHGLLRCPTRV